MFSRQNTGFFGEYIFRSSCPELFYEKGALKNFAKFGKHLCQSLLFNKVVLWKPPTLLKRDHSTLLSCEFCKNFEEHIFCETPANSCFCILPIWRPEEPGEKVAYTQFVAHSFDVITLELETKEMLLICLQIQNKIHYDFFKYLLFTRLYLLLL